MRSSRLKELSHASGNACLKSAERSAKEEEENGESRRLCLIIIIISRLMSRIGDGIGTDRCPVVPRRGKCWIYPIPTRFPADPQFIRAFQGVARGAWALSFAGRHRCLARHVTAPLAPPAAAPADWRAQINTMLHRRISLFPMTSAA